MKTLKAIFHWIRGYELHQKEHIRLETLWFNIKVGIITILFILMIISLLTTIGFFYDRIKL